tara:strand:+ start:1216 stop:3984 length:2769 start_codon:yes stop_codon:yes gene_type:complete
MAQKPRTQVDVPFGQAPLRPAIQGAGRNQVFVAPLPRQTSAQVLAKNLSQFSQVLGQFSNVQKQRGREAAMALTNDEVIAQIDGSSPRRFNPFDKIGFQKQFSEDVYTRAFDLRIKPQLTQLGNDIKRMGVEQVTDADQLDKIIDEGLGRINEEALKGLGDDNFQKYAHNVLFSNAAAKFKASTNEAWNLDRQEYLKDASAESSDRSLIDTVEGVFKFPAIPKGGIVVLPKHRATAYGLASIDPTTAEDQAKADAGVPGYEGFDQKKGSGGERLIPGYSVASNYYPQGTILDIDGKEYRVDDTGGMALNVVDFYAGDDQKMYKAFANKKIKSVKVVDPSAKSPEKVKGGVQQWASYMDDYLYKSGHTTTSARKTIMMKSLENVVTDYANKGDFIQAREIIDSIEGTIVNNVPVFKGGLASSLEEKIQRIEEKTSVDNAKASKEKAQSELVDFTSVFTQLRAEASATEPKRKTKEISTNYEDIVPDPIKNLIDLELQNVRKELTSSRDDGNTFDVQVKTEKLKQLLSLDAAHEASLDETNLVQNTNPLELYAATVTSRTKSLTATILSNPDLKGKLWHEVEGKDALGNFMDMPTLLDPNLIKGLIALEERQFDKKNKETLRTFKLANPLHTDTELLDLAYEIVGENADASNENIDRELARLINEATESDVDITPTTPKTKLEENVSESLKEGDTPEDAKRFGLSDTLEGKDTFDAKDGNIVLDLDKVFGFGDSYAGNYEREDYDKYNDLYTKSKETGVFKDNESDVSKFFENRKTILKESDFFSPLVTTVKRFTYERPSLTEMGVGGLYPSGVYKSTETQYRNAKRDIKKFLIETGVTLEDAQQGMFMGYPLKEIIQRNWEKMPILSFNELQFTGEVEKILKKNNLDKPHYMRDSFGEPDTKPAITVDQFIEAQRKLITDQTK